jgi:hypothetical protein
MGKTNNYAECTKTLNKSFVTHFENESFPIENEQLIIEK